MNRTIKLESDKYTSTGFPRGHEFLRGKQCDDVRVCNLVLAHV